MKNTGFREKMSIEKWQPGAVSNLSGEDIAV
jgi:hypothetical protein